MIGNEHALTYLKERYVDERQMLKDVEDKAIKLTSLLSLLIAALSTVLKLNSQPFTSPTDRVDWALIVLAVYLFIYLFCSLLNAMLAIKIGYFPIVPNNRIALEYIKEVEKYDCEEYISRCYIDVIEILKTETESKVKSLHYCYSDLVTSAFLACIFFVTFYLSKL